MKDIIAIGSVTQDNFLDGGNLALRRYPQTPSGKAFILPLGDKLAVKSAYSTIGGNSANASVTFARQGFRTAVVGRVGNDERGEIIIRRLRKERVATSMLAVDGKVPTAFAVLLLKGGERTILNYHGSSNGLSIADIDFRNMRSAWWYLSLPGRSEELYGKLLDFAWRNKIAVALNPSSYHLKRGRSGILRSLKKLSLLSLNEEEAAILTGIPFSREREVFKKLDDLTSPGILAVTDGSRGVTVSDGHFVYRAGTFKEKKLVDRTGAGDAWGSGFVAGLWASGVARSNARRVTRDQVAEAIRVASANATSVVERVGATEGILTARELKQPRWKNLRITVEKL